LPRGGGVHYTALHSTPGTLPPVKSITSGNGVTAPETGPGQKQSKLIAKTGEKKKEKLLEKTQEKRAGKQAAAVAASSRLHFQCCFSCNSRKSCSSSSSSSGSRTKAQDLVLSQASASIFRPANSEQSVPPAATGCIINV